MKKTAILALTIMFFYTLTGCGQGFVTSNPPPAPTYIFSSDFYENATSNNSTCNVLVSPFICNKNSSSITMSLSFSSSNPATYWQIPVTAPSLPTGATITQSPGCSNITGINYSCMITINADNVAESSIINIPFNGSLGTIANYIITYQ